MSDKKLSDALHREQQEKEQAEARYRDAGMAGFGCVTSGKPMGYQDRRDENQCGPGATPRPDLRDRIYSQRVRAESSARNADRLRELELLLDKNPEVARILDLLEQVKDA